jgi:tetratricopeptide (TPR) repeat protein
LGPAYRTRLHQRLGARLERGYGERAAEIAPVLALHFEQGRDILKAVRYLGVAAENSARRLANQEATNYLSHALTLVSRLPSVHQTSLRIRLLRQRSWGRRASGDLAGCLDDLNAVIALAAETGELHAEVNGLLAVSRFALHADRRTCLSAAARVLERSETIEDENFRALVRGTSASTSLYLNGWNETDAALCRQALELTAGARDHATLIRRHGIEGLFKCATSDYVAARNAATLGKRMTRALGDVFVFVLFNVLEATALLHLGEWRALRRETAEALALAERNVNEPAAVLCRLTLAWLYVEAHDFLGSIRLCEGISDGLLRDTPFTFYFQRAVLAKAYHGMRDLAGTWASANDILRDLRDSDDGLDFTIYTQFHYCLSDHYIQVGDLAKAREHAMILHAYTVKAPDRNHLALAYRLLARIAMIGGGHAEATAYLEQAVDMLSDGPLPLAAWRVHLLAVELHRDTGAEDRAIYHWRRYAETIHKLAGSFDEGDTLRVSLLSALTFNKTRLRINDAG